MPANTNNAKGSLLDAAPLRHGVSAAVALGLNAAVVLLLVTWAGRRRADTRPAVRAVALSVLPAQADRVQPTSPEAPAEAAVVEPPPAPMLPPLPQPAVSLPTLSLDAPTPLEIALHPALDLPAYETESISPIIIQPARPSPGPAAPPRLHKPAGSGPDRGPMLLSRPDLSDYYPRRALARGVTGRTRLRLTVDAIGRVTDVQVVASQPAGVFEHAAGRVGRVLHFRPAVRAGRNVPAVVSLSLVWKVE